MKRFSLTYTLLSILFVSGFSGLYAHEQVTSGYKMGWCIDQTSGECNYSFPEKKAVSAAICYDAVHANRLVGNQIESIRFALQSTLRFDSLAVWVSTSLDADPLHCEVLTKRQIVKGWNEVRLASPCSIEADCDYYLGYTYYQTGEALAITTSPVFDEAHGRFWVKDGDAAWMQTDNIEQTLSIEGCLQGPNLPQYDVQLRGITLLYDSIHSGQHLYVKARLRNNALQSIDQVTVCVNAEAMPVAQLTADVEMEYQAEGDICIKIDTPDDLVVEQGVLNINILSLNDGREDEWEDDNDCSVLFTSAPELFVKNILVEEFTSEPCGNCPRLSQLLEACYSQHPLQHHIACASHHVGFQDDWLTLDASRPYTLFFMGSSYNPAIMTDRTYRKGAEDIVWNPGNTTSILSSWENALSKPTTVMLDADAIIEGQQLRMQIEGFRSADYDIQNPRLTVMIVEDSIPAKYQYNGGPNWVHEHTTLAISQTWGEEVTWSGDKFETEVTMTCPESMRLSHSHVLILLSEFGEDIVNRRVENVTDIPLDLLLANSHGLSTIKDIAVDTLTNQQGRSFNLMGIPCRDGKIYAKGLYIHNGKVISIQ